MIIDINTKKIQNRHTVFTRKPTTPSIHRVVLHQEKIKERTTQTFWICKRFRAYIEKIFTKFLHLIQVDAVFLNVYVKTIEISHGPTNTMSTN